MAFGLGDQLVGITRYCIHPSSALEKIEAVGGTKNPNIKRILELHPDLLLMNKEENREEDFRALSQHLTVDVSFPKTIADVPDHLRHLGQLVSAQTLAETMAAQLENALERLAEARRQHPHAKFSFMYLIWRKPWMAVGPDTYVHDLLTRAGGINVVEATDVRYPELSLQDYTDQTSLYVLLSDEPYPFNAQHIPEVRQHLPNADIQTISGDDACWHGIRSLRGADLALRLFKRFALNNVD